MVDEVVLGHEELAQAFMVFVALEKHLDHPVEVTRLPSRVPPPELVEHLVVFKNDGDAQWSHL
jgi:hypothetical protein